MARKSTEAVAVMDRTNTATSTQTRTLSGPWGASFTGEGTKGLTFERRWTTPGIHPYDEITWKTRNASIGHQSGKLRVQAEGRQGPGILEPASDESPPSESNFPATFATPETPEQTSRQLESIGFSNPNPGPGGEKPRI